MLTRLLSLFLMSLLLFSILTQSAIADDPSSTNYKMTDYSFGSGGTADSDSTNYSIFGSAGQVEGGLGTSTNYKVGEGLTYMMQANVPPAPTFTNPSTNYDRLKITLNTGGNPTDAQFAIALSTDDFVTTRYVQSDDTTGSTLGSEDWQTYADWGGASGTYITGLVRSTTYKVKVKARHGDYTESGWGPTASATTSDPTLSFGVSANSVTFDNLNSGNSFTDSAKSTTLTTSTNAYNGYTVYGRATGVLSSNGNEIAHYTSANSSPTTWSGTGFGYTTDDSNLIGGTANRFTSGGAKYAGFTTSSPGDPVADHPGPITTAISSEQFTVSYRVTADSSTKAGNYTTTLLYIVVPNY
jgi:hypothetical protein